MGLSISIQIWGFPEIIVRTNKFNLCGVAMGAMLPRHTLKRREYLKLVSVGGLAAVAGCTSGDDTTEDGEDSGGGATPTEGQTATESDESSDLWPPRNNTVTVIQPSGLGGIMNQFVRAYDSVLGEHWPGDTSINTAIVNRPGAGGLTGLQDLYASDPNGGTFGTPFYGQAPEAKQEGLLEPTELEWFANGYTTLRAFGLNPVSMPIDSHFDVSSTDDLVEIVDEHGPLNVYQSVSSPGMSIVSKWMFENVDGISEEDFNYVPVGGVEEGRSLFLSGDLDAYFTLLNLQYIQRDDFIKVQWALGDPEFTPGIFETFQGLQSGDGEHDGFPKEQWLTEVSGFPTEAAKQIGRVHISGMAMALPPGTPDEILDIYYEAFQGAAEDPARIEMLEKQGNASVDSPQVGPEVNNIIADIVEQRLNNETFLRLQKEFSDIG
jgi:tripartite-type tricarboxylate transporter receptor subunit TctC